MEKFFTSILFASAICALCVTTSCVDKRDTLVQIKQSVVSEETSYLSLRVAKPNVITLRSESTDEDPLQHISALRFVFYSTGGESIVKVVKEIAISSDQDLDHITLQLPANDYRLVVIANATPKLVGQTQLSAPLSYLTDPKDIKGKELLQLENYNVRAVSLINDQGPIDIARSSFSSEPTSRVSTPDIHLEGILSRVLVYGEPKLQGGTKGLATPTYVEANIASAIRLLRGFALLSTGEMEHKDDHSSLSQRYAQSWLGDQTPSSTTGISNFSKNDLLTDKNWREITATPTTDLHHIGLYLKENTMPATAYLQGIAPAIIVAYPFVPHGITLSEGEGFVSYRGRYYGENALRQEMRNGSVSDPQLKEALSREKIEDTSFAQPFDKNGICFYQKAISYYVVYIRHFDDKVAPTPQSQGRYGLVRNNEYRVELRSIGGIGSSIVPSLKDNLEPLQEYERVAVSIATNSVQRHTQQVDL